MKSAVTKESCGTTCSSASASPRLSFSLLLPPSLLLTPANIFLLADLKTLKYCNSLLTSFNPFDFFFSTNNYDRHELDFTRSFVTLILICEQHNFISWLIIVVVFCNNYNFLYLFIIVLITT